MNKLLKLFSSFGPIIALVAVVVVVIISNYSLGTWLSGWDALHPEFNFLLYFQRIFWGVWQEHQGLGAVASQAHIAELPRMLLYYPLSLFLPLNFVRYAYFFIMLFVGPLGTYFFLQKTILRRLNPSVRNISSFLGALLYLFNLGTLQIFYIPFEMFATIFAFLPWLFLSCSRYLGKGDNKSLLYFSLLTFFSGSIAHTSTLFWAYLLILFVYCLVVYIFSRDKKWSRIIKVLGLTLLINLYWILPNIYFILSHGSEVINSKINLQFSGQAFDKAKLFSNLSDLAQLKNYLFDWGQYDSSREQFLPLFASWESYLNLIPVLLLRYFLFGIALLGGLSAVIKRLKFQLAIFLVFLVSILFIGNDLPLVGNLYAFLREHFPIFGEALRFPFTKFSPFLILGYSVLFAVGAGELLSKLEDISSRYKLKTFVLGIIFTLFAAVIILTMFPVFQGHLIDQKMKTQIPKDYFEMFSWFNREPMGRIAAFPDNTFWGWTYYRWDYEGAGFMWFGLKQPILLREFDKWNSLNENYYWEVSQAVYSKDLQMLENVFEKYQVNWLLIDENVFDPSSPKSVYTPELEEMLSHSQRILLAKQFGKIKIYTFTRSTSDSNFISALSQPAKVGPKYNWEGQDQAYKELGNYLNVVPEKADVYYPFRSLFSNRSLSEIEYNVSEKDSQLVFAKDLPQFATPHQISYQTYLQDKQISFDQSGSVVFNDPLLVSDNKSVTVSVPENSSIYSRQVNIAKGLSETNCDPHRGGTVQSSLIAQDNSPLLQIKANNAINCLSYSLTDLPHDYGYLVSIESQWVSGRPILFWVENLNSRRSDIEIYLSSKPLMETSRIIIPPMEKDGLGYVFHFDVGSIGSEKSEDYLKSVKIEPIPYRLLKSIKLSSQNLVVNPQITVLNVQHPNPATYFFPAINLNEGDILTLSQSFEKGWSAYIVNNNVPFWLSPVLGQKLNDHMLVNNWENGWSFDSAQDKTKKIVIIYLPQYLEFFGFGVLGLLIIIGMISYLRSQRKS